MIKTNLSATEARWIPPNSGIWIQFPRGHEKQVYLPVKHTQVEDAMKMIILFPPANSGAYPIKRTYWDKVPYQRVFPLRELPTIISNEPSRSPAGA